MGEHLFSFFFWQKNRKEWAESGHGDTSAVRQRHLVATLSNYVIGGDAKTP